MRYSPARQGTGDLTARPAPGGDTQPTGGVTQAPNRVLAQDLDEPFSSSPGDLSGERRPAGSSTKLRVWRGQIRDSTIATFGRRCAIKRHDVNGAKAATRRTNASIQVVQAHAWYTNEDCPGLWTNSTPEKPQSELPYDIKRCEALSAISGPASTHVAPRRGIFGRSQA